MFDCIFLWIFIESFLFAEDDSEDPYNSIELLREYLEKRLGIEKFLKGLSSIIHLFVFIYIGLKSTKIHMKIS